MRHYKFTPGLGAAIRFQNSRPAERRSKKLEHARESGRKAAMRGASISNCHYTDPERFDAWVAAYREAKEQGQ